MGWLAPMKLWGPQQTKAANRIATSYMIMHDQRPDREEVSDAVNQPSSQYNSITPKNVTALPP
jgi:hypothetical protein